MSGCTRAVQLRCLLLFLSRMTGLGCINTQVTATLAVLANTSVAEAPGTRARVESAAPRAGLGARAMCPGAALARCPPGYHQGTAEGRTNPQNTDLEREEKQQPRHSLLLSPSSTWQSLTNTLGRTRATKWGGPWGSPPLRVASTLSFCGSCRCRGTHVVLPPPAASVNEVV